MPPLLTADILRLFLPAEAAFSLGFCSFASIEKTLESVFSQLCSFFGGYPISPNQIAAFVRFG